MDTCILCKSSKHDDIQYGEFLKNRRFGVHTFCLYLSSNLSQNGADDEGFLGFLEADIKAEVHRISSLKCSYCNKKYANVGCCEKKCRRVFHFICGLENKAGNQFCHDFRSFCHTHVTKVQQRPAATETCLICYDSLCDANHKFNSVNMILTPCCRNGWFHKLCLQKFAKTAGYFFKCPLCNDANTFRKKLPSRGIFIPNQDAAWELEPNAFAELLERPSECAASECINKKGRKADNTNNPFVMCTTCGSTAMHRQCLPNGGKRFHCADCTIGLEENDSGRESLNMAGNQEDNEDDHIDVCHVSDKEDLDIVNRLIASTSGNKRDERTQGPPDYESSDDDAIFQTRTNFPKNRLRISEESDEDSANEEKINPVKSSRSRRLLSEDENSKDSANNKHIETNSSNLSLSSDKKNNKAEDEEINIPNFKVNIRRLKCDSTCSSDSNQSQVFEYQHQIETDDSEYDMCITSKRRTNNILKDSEEDKTLETEENEEKGLVRRSRKRKSLNMLQDSKEEQWEINDKHKRLDAELTDKEEIESLATDESEDDDDPLENFHKIIEKQKNISCIALRTRQSQNQHNKPQDFQMSLQTINEKENESNEPNFTSTTRKSLEMQSRKSTSAAKTRSQFDKPPTNLDVSCVAKRTRRKTCYFRRDADSEVKENPSNVSCIATRTRRKTICADARCQPGSLYELSQVSEKIHESDEEVQVLESEEESEFNEVVIDSDDFTVDDGYEEKDSRYDVSCIANRTRKRKSMRSINGHSMTSSSSCSSTSTSTSSSSSSSSLALSNVNLRKRRICSSSSEEMETPPKCLKALFSPSLLLDQLPQHNYTAFIGPKHSTKVSSSNPIQNYHLTNHYNHHRKRL